MAGVGLAVGAVEIAGVEVGLAAAAVGLGLVADGVLAGEPVADVHDVTRIKVTHAVAVRSMGQ